MAGFKTLMRRVIKKLTFWLIRNAYEKQMAFNAKLQEDMLNLKQDLDVTKQDLKLAYEKQTALDTKWQEATLQLKQDLDVTKQDLNVAKQGLDVIKKDLNVAKQDLKLTKHKLRYGVNDILGVSNPLESSLARRQDLVALNGWVHRLHSPAFSRKAWEWVYITQALSERGMLSSGKRGLVFAVGREPLPALFASMGVQVLATDLHENLLNDIDSNWNGTNQHATNVESLFYNGICDADTFHANVKFMPLDMNNIPDDLCGFDFCWSSCAVEHIGGTEKARTFFTNMLKLLKPGGVAVHTTEYNISGPETVDDPHCAIFGKDFLDELIAGLTADGHSVTPLDLRLGNHPEDDSIYAFDGTPQRFKLLLSDKIATSIGIIVTRSTIP